MSATCTVTYLVAEDPGRVSAERESKRWAGHGSTRWLWKPENVSAAIRYVVYGQGGPCLAPRPSPAGNRSRWSRRSNGFMPSSPLRRAPDFGAVYLLQRERSVPE